MVQKLGQWRSQRKQGVYGILYFALGGCAEQERWAKDEVARRAATEAQRPAFIEHLRGRCIEFRLSAGSDDLAACTQRMFVLAAADAQMQSMQEQAAINALAAPSGET